MVEGGRRIRPGGAPDCARPSSGRRLGDAAVGRATSPAAHPGPASGRSGHGLGRLSEPAPGLAARRHAAAGESRRRAHRDHLAGRRHRRQRLPGPAPVLRVWIATAWPQGATVTMMAGTICALFGIRDEPVRPAQRFLAMSVAGSVLAMIYLFGVLPRIDGFVPLTLVLLPVFLPLAMCLQRPVLAAKAMPVIMGSLGPWPGADLRRRHHRLRQRRHRPQSRGRDRGAGAAARPVPGRRVGGRAGDAGHAPRRGPAGCRRPLLDRATFESRMHDRLALLVPALARADQALARRLGDALMAFGSASTSCCCARATPDLPRTARQCAGTLMPVDHRSRPDDRRDPGGNLAHTLAAGRRTLSALATAPLTPAATEALLALAGIRHALSWHGPAGASRSRRPP